MNVLIDADTGKRPGVDNAGGYMTGAKECVFIGETCCFLFLSFFFFCFLSVLRRA